MVNENKTNERVRIPREPKGKIPQYFADPATDKLLSMVLAIMEELSVTYDRVDTLEQLLAEQGVLKSGQVDDFLPDDDLAARRANRRAEFLSRVTRSIREEERNLGGIDVKYADEEML